MLIKAESLIYLPLKQLPESDGEVYNEGYRNKVESTKKKSKHDGQYDTPTELGIKWKIDVEYIPSACNVGADGEKFYQYHD